MNLNHNRSLYLVSLAHFALELSANYLPIIYPILIATMGLSYTQIGFTALVYGTGSSIAQPVFGYLSDRWSPQRITILSVLWIGLLMGLIGLTQSYWALVLLVALGSLGSAAFHPAGASIALISSGGGSRRGAALSIFSVGGNLGSALSPLWVTLGIALIGIRGTTILIPVALLISVLLFRQLDLSQSSSDLMVSAKKSSSQKSGQPSAGGGSLVALILIIIAVMGRNWFQTSMFTYLPEWMHSQGWSIAASGQILSAMLISVSVGSFLGGHLSDRIGRWQVVALSLGLLSPAHWLFLATSSFLQIGILLLMGVFVGASFPVTIVMAQETWPRSVGMASALVMGVAWLPGGIGASLTGFIADQSSLEAGLKSLTIALIIGTICAIAYPFYFRQAVANELLPDIP